MHFEKTPIAGLLIVTIAPMEDERGLFARTWDATEAKQHHLVERFDYTCISTNRALHTLRGMHYQTNKSPETKLVRCTKGSIYDVVIDLRPDSPTFMHWYGAELTDTNHQALYIPPHCAHGFLTLTPDSEVLYAISGAYDTSAAKGVRFDDHAFRVTWPAAPEVISQRDSSYSSFVL